MLIWHIKADTLTDWCCQNCRCHLRQLTAHFWMCFWMEPIKIIYSVLLYANSSGDNKVPDLLSSSKMRPYLSVYHILLNVSVSVFSDSLQSKSSLELFCLFQLLTLLTLWLPVCWLAWIDGLLNPAPERRLTNHSIATVTRKGLSSFWFLHMPWEFFFITYLKPKTQKISSNRSYRC